MKAKNAEISIRRTEITIETVSVTRIRRGVAAAPPADDLTPENQVGSLVRRSVNQEQQEKK